MRQDLIALLGRIVGDAPLPEDLQRVALDLFAKLLQQPSDAVLESAPPRPATAPIASGGFHRVVGDASGAAVGNRRLVNVHGICRHSTGFSDAWWAALGPFVPTAFGAGTLGETRLEVVWSDIVNLAAAARAAAVGAAFAAGGPTAALPANELARRRAAAEIKEALNDRADQHVANVAMRNAAGPLPVAANTSGMISIPGLNCIDDFSTYLTDNGVRQQILDRFIQVVRPELQAGRELDIVGHSWGTVVAYEGLRQLEDEGLVASHVRNLFTVGAALSLGPVKRRLRDANQDGRKPASVRRWVNLDAYGDIVGGPLQGRPFAVDFDFVNLDAFGCGSFLGMVNPRCAHNSYFSAGNTAVNRDIFARFIDSP